MICQSCQNPVSETERFCPKCGRRNPAASPAQPAEPARRRFNWRILVFALIVLAPVLVYGLKLLQNRIDHGDYTELNLKELGNFPIITRSIEDVPKKFQAYDGKKVLLIGEWYPTVQSGPKFTEFQLVWSIANCCFGGPPQPQERVFVHLRNPMQLPPGKMIKVYGQLHVEVRKDPGGKVISVYTLDADKIEQST